MYDPSDNGRSWYLSVLTDPKTGRDYKLLGEVLSCGMISDEVGVVVAIEEMRDNIMPDSPDYYIHVKYPSLDSSISHMVGSTSCPSPVV